MMKLLRVSLFVLLLPASVLAEKAGEGEPVAERKTPPAVIDGAKLFSSEATKKAEEIVARIRERFELDVCLETVKDLPGLSAKTRLSQQRDQLHDEAQKRADDHGVHGLFILVASEAHMLVSVVGWPADRELDSYLSDFKRKDLRRFLEKELHENPNRALVVGLEQYELRLNRDRILGASPLNVLLALILLGGLLGLWLVARIVRHRLVTPEHADPLYRPWTQASLFGVPASFWITDGLYRSERPAVVEAPVQAQVEAPANDTTHPTGTPT